MSRDRRVRRDQPYLDQHLARSAELARRPRSFGELLNWFLEGFRAETPEAMHVDGVWASRRRLDANARPADGDVALYEPQTGRVLADGSALSGGSQLGSPRQAEPFRQLIENSPRQWTDEGGTVDPYFVRPMRAALARMAGNDSGGESAFMARFLLQVAFAGGDWQGVADRWELASYARVAYVETALRRLNRCWRPDPSVAIPSWVDRSESQQAADVAGEEGVA